MERVFKSYSKRLTQANGMDYLVLTSCSAISNKITFWFQLHNWETSLNFIWTSTMIRWSISLSSPTSSNWCHPSNSSSFHKHLFVKEVDRECNPILPVCRRIRLHNLLLILPLPLYWTMDRHVSGHLCKLENIWMKIGTALLKKWKWESF